MSGAQAGLCAICVRAYMCMCMCVCACVCTAGPGWWRVPSCSHTLFCKMSNPHSDGDETARLWALDLLHPLPAHPIVNLDPEEDRTMLGKMCKVRAGLTPLYISFKMRSEPDCKGFNLSPCTFANQSPEVVLGPSPPSSITG